MTPMPRFFSFDGLDGSGKSTQIELFRDWLVQLGRDVVVCRDPGSTTIGESIRQLLLDRRSTDMTRTAEMLLYMAARAQMVETVIRPALAEGKTVVSDRYLLANVVYQGHAGGLDVATLWGIGSVATGGLEPDLTFVLDISPEVAAGRMDRPLDRMELQGDEFRTRVRAGFLAEAARRPERIAVIDARQSIAAVHEAIKSAAEIAR